MFKNKVKITPQMRKQIIKDWCDAFPILKKRNERSFARIVGPLRIGIGYSYEYGVEYRPAFSITNLCNVEDGLYATLHTTPPTRRYAITWPQHEKGLYKEAVQQLKDNAPLSIEGEIKLSQVIKAFEEQSKEKGLHDHEMESPALIASWCGRNDLAHKLAKKVRDESIKDTEEGDYENKEELIKNDEIWYEGLLKRLDTEKLRTAVDAAIVEHKLTKLPRHELIIDY